MDFFNSGILAFISKKSDGNIAYHVNDDKNSVDINRKRLADTYGYNNNDLKYMKQIHSSLVEVADKSYTASECDALITNQTDTPIMVMVADCIPIMMHDEQNGVIAVVHAGRNGTFCYIAKKTVNSMTEKFGSNPNDIKVFLGPSIRSCCYEVSDEIAKIAEKNFGKKFVSGRFIDLQGINKKQLLDEGILSENIKISQICTKCGNEDHFSYRLDKECGRFCAVMMLKK